MVPFLIFGILAAIIPAGVECAPGSVSPCEPNPCGPNSQCRLHLNTQAVCSCLPDYGGRPPTCRKLEAHLETVKDESCNSKNCGVNSICSNDARGHGVCQCKPGYEIRHLEGGFCSQCVTNFDCDSNQTCSNFECVDPCPGDCGSNDECYVFNHKASCRPKGSQPQCSSNADCPSDKACDGYKCADPCSNLCNLETADCKVTNHEPTCTCKSGFYGSPERFCLQNGYVE